jgi:hypothetical protein
MKNKEIKQKFQIKTAVMEIYIYKGFFTMTLSNGKDKR